MSLDIGVALREGARRLGTPSGLQLVGLLLAVGLFNTVAIQSFYPAYAALLRDAGATLPPNFPPPTPLALDVGLGPVLAVMFAVALAGEAVRIVGVRAMVREETTAIPAALATRRLGRAVSNGFVGGVVVLLLVGLGTVVLVLPGVYLAVALFFVRQVVAVEDRNFVEAIERSWALTAGARLEVLVLGVVFAGLFVTGVMVPSFVLSALLGQGSVVPPLVTAALGAVTAGFSVAATSRAYLQLAAADREGHGDRGDADGDGEEWPDPPGLDL